MHGTFMFGRSRASQPHDQPVIGLDSHPYVPVGEDAISGVNSVWFTGYTVHTARREVIDVRIGQGTDHDLRARHGAVDVAQFLERRAAD